MVRLRGTARKSPLLSTSRERHSGQTPSSKAGGQAGKQRPYPSAQRAGDFELKGPGRLRPPHRVRSYRVSRAAHGLKANRGFIKLSHSRLKVNFSNLKVKEKNKEYSSGYRECSNKASTRGGYDFLRQRSERALLYARAAPHPPLTGCAQTPALSIARFSSARKPFSSSSCSSPPLYL